MAFMYSRDYIGIDTEKEYLDLSIKRFEDLKKNKKWKKEMDRIKKGKQTTLS